MKSADEKKLVDPIQGWFLFLFYFTITNLIIVTDKFYRVIVKDSLRITLGKNKNGKFEIWLAVLYRCRYNLKAHFCKDSYKLVKAQRMTELDTQISSIYE